MKTTKAIKLMTLAFVTILTGCSDSIVILKGLDFNEGDWLLVNSNGNKGTLFVIDDEKVLQENPNGIKVKFSSGDQYTTTDGSLKLFKDGKLVEDQGYLYPSKITESNNIRNAYRKATYENIYPLGNTDFKRQWDSLKAMPKCYPTVYHTQPDDKDIIRYYLYD